MLGIFEQLIAKAVRFAGDRRGNVALTFGIATLPLIGAVGAAVDYSHANSVKAAMQSALDSTALMLARDASTMTDPNLDAKAKAYFAAMFTRPEATNIVVNATYSTTTGSQVLVTGSARVPTTIMAIAGYTTMTINGSSTAKWGSERLRVALALDNTGSMADHGKMTALKSATKSLLTQLKNAASVNGDVHVSIIPFSEDVNVGASNYNASWLDWEEWEDENERLVCSRRRCRTVTLNHNQWNGCVADRGGKNGPTGQNYDQNVTAPGSSKSSKFPADQSDDCPVQMKGLTYDWAALNSLVDSMNPAGMTNQPIGLVWAWQSLVGGGPLSAPAKSSSYAYKEVIVLMSDGLNTENRWWSSQSSIDKRMYDPAGGTGTCANIKAAGITIYAVHVNTGGDPTSTLMRNCASDSDKFWEVKTAGDLGAVFSKIGTDVNKLRVAQ